MKKVSLFCTKIWFYLTEIPPIVLMIFAIIYNTDDGIGLYPLIVFSAAVAIMIFIYFFRMIVISNEEIRSIGLFSSRDSAVIEKDTKLQITIESGGNLHVALLGKRKMPDFSWSKIEDYPSCDVNIYRERAVGGKSAVARILKYFEVSSADIDCALKSDSFEKDYDYFTFSSIQGENSKQITLSFT